MRVMRSSGHVRVRGADFEIIISEGRRRFPLRALTSDSHFEHRCVLEERKLAQASMRTAGRTVWEDIGGNAAAQDRNEHAMAIWQSN